MKLVDGRVLELMVVVWWGGGGLTANGLMGIAWLSEKKLTTGMTTPPTHRVTEKSLTDIKNHNTTHRY